MYICAIRGFQNQFEDYAHTLSRISINTHASGLFINSIRDNISHRNPSEETQKLHYCLPVPQPFTMLMKLWVLFVSVPGKRYSQISDSCSSWDSAKAIKTFVSQNVKRSAEELELLVKNLQSELLFMRKYSKKLEKVRGLILVLFGSIFLRSYHTCSVQITIPRNPWK